MDEETWSLASVPERIVVTLSQYLARREPRWEDGSPARWVSLPRTMSGPQPVASPLEEDLVAQVAFSYDVHDALTHAVVADRGTGSVRPHTVTLVLQTESHHGTGPTRYLVQLVDAAHLRRNPGEREAEIDAAKAFALRERVAYRCLREADVRTPYLDNARLLGHHLNAWPENENLGAIYDATEHVARPVREVVATLVAKGVDPTEARAEVKRAVANRFVHCDLGQPVDGETLLSKRSMGMAMDPLNDPFLRMIREAGEV